MKFIFLGDVHGNISYCAKIARRNPDCKIVQVGDFGVGFVSLEEINSKLPNNFHFFVGNHDNRQEAKKLSYCLGDYGEAFDGKFFFVSGADSIDKSLRTFGKDWWPDEELGYHQVNDCIEQWAKSKCEILACHDCPQSLVSYEPSFTRKLLQTMIEIRKPSLIIHGHHHFSGLFNVNGTTIKSLDIQEPYRINIL